MNTKKYLEYVPMLFLCLTMMIVLTANSTSVRAQTQPPNPQILYQDQQYKIVYQPQAHNYIIVILRKEFDQIRTAAEAKFLEVVKVNKDEACEFRVTIVTPYSVNPTESVTTKNLSFCQGFQKPGKQKFKSSDLNGDGVVNTLDYTLILINYHKKTEKTDINSDGTVNALDASIVIENLGKTVN